MTIFTPKVRSTISNIEMKKAKSKKGDSPTSAGEQLAENPLSNEQETDCDRDTVLDSTVILSAIQTMKNSMNNRFKSAATGFISVTNSAI